MAEVEADMKNPVLRKALDDAVLRMGPMEPGRPFTPMSDAELQMMAEEEMEFCPHCFQSAGHDGPCVQVVA